MVATAAVVVVSAAAATVWLPLAQAFVNKNGVCILETLFHILC